MRRVGSHARRTPHPTFYHEVEAEIARLAGKLFRLEIDTEIWKLLEEDSFEWSAQYSDFLVYYCDSEQGEDPEVHHSVWTWLVSAMEVSDESRMRFSPDLNR